MIVAVTENCLPQDLLKTKIETYEYESEELIKQLGGDEINRTIDMYYIMVDLMNNMEMMIELVRMKKLVKDHPSKLNLKLKLGIIRRKINDHNVDRKSLIQFFFPDGTEGKHFFKEAMETDPLHIQILYNTAKIYIDREEYDKFVEYFGLMKQHHPTNRWTLFIECYFLMENERIEEGIKLMESRLPFLRKGLATHKYGLVNISRSYRALKNEEMFLKYMNDFNEKMVLTKRSQYGLKEMGWFHVEKFEVLRNKNTEKEQKKSQEHLMIALDYFMKAKELSTDEAYYAIGIVHEYLEKIEDSLKFLDREMVTDPFGRVCLKTKIDIYIKNKDDIILKQVEQGTEINDPDGYIFDKANIEAERLIKFHPYPDSYLKMAMLYERILGLQQSTDYLQEFALPELFRNRRKSNEENLTLSEDDDSDSGDTKKKNDDEGVYRIHFVLAFQLNKLCEFELAIEQANKAIELKPLHFESFLVRGEALLDFAETDKALKDFNYLIEKQKEYNLKIEQQKEEHQQEKGGNDGAVSTTNNNIIIIRKKDEFLEEFKKFKRMDEVYHLKAWAYQADYKDFEEAIVNFKLYKLELSRKMGNESSDPLISHIYPHERLSLCYLKINQFGKSYTQLLKALKIYETQVANGPLVTNFETVRVKILKRRSELLESHEMKVLLGGRKRKVASMDLKERILFLKMKCCSLQQQQEEEEEEEEKKKNCERLFGGLKMVKIVNICDRVDLIVFDFFIKFGIFK